MGSTNTFSPDTSSILFVHSSDIPGILLVPTPFLGSNFRGWRRKIIVALSTKNKIAFVDGSLSSEIVESGALDIASYFNKLKMLWDELGVMCTNHGQRCTCAAKPGILHEDEENRLFQFLMGLNETCMRVRSNLLMMQPPPSLDNAYNILPNDEK
ncbi:uncharacterized protein [Nicotiana sylvestris]|uniref:uncharacterized protein n=1 Tax=Nicotiana sylvestris TaxID=4096 RepID=UPI00388CE4DD